MASGAEVPEYSSPSKRARLDGDGANAGNRRPSEDQLESSANGLDREGNLNDNSGFAELSDNVKPASSSSDMTNSSSTPTRTDSMSDDTGFPLDTADEKDEVSSTVSNLSDITGISILSDDGDESMDIRNASSWVQKQIQMGTDPRDVLKLLFSDPTQIPEEVDDFTLWRIVINMMSEPPKRQKLSNINTITDVVELIKKSKNIIVLTGAGVSVSCGIPDFRSRDGIYSRLAQDFPDLPDPQAMFDINYFSQDPRPFYKFAREIYPGQFKPSPCHRFIKMLEDQNKLLRNYSQNIDTLERVAGIKNLIECHGSFATASCTKCKHQVRSDDVKAEIFAQTIPMCPKCQEQSLPSIGESNSNKNYKDLVAQGVMKPDIVFFGEGLPDAFHDAMSSDKDVCDLLIVIGSSLKVRPVALIPSSIPPNVPQILINRESLPHLEFDIELLGDGDIVINQLCHMLEGKFKEICWRDTILEEATRLLPPPLPLNDSWDQSQDTLTNQDFSQDSGQVDQDSFLMGSTSKRELRLFNRDDEDDSTTLDSRPWKKIKTDSDLKEILEDEQISCTKFYSNIVDYYEKKKNFTDEDTSKITGSDSDTESKSEDQIASASPLRDSNHSNNQKEKQPLDDRLWSTEESKRWKKEELDNNSNSKNECTDVRNLTFHSEYTEHTVKCFSFTEDSRGRQLESLSFESNLRQGIGSSPKSIDSPRKSITLSSGESPTTSYESSRITEEIYISEDCHVVPRIDCLREDSILGGSLDPLKSSDKIDMKPRHASIDSVMDSALGDSCSSSDCQKRKNDSDDSEETKKFRKLDSHSWSPLDRESLAARLPENTFYQMKPGKYIFQGAEVYTDFPWNEGVLQIGGLRSALTESQLREH